MMKIFNDTSLYFVLASRSLKELKYAECIYFINMCKEQLIKENNYKRLIYLYFKLMQCNLHFNNYIECYELSRQVILMCKSFNMDGYELETSKKIFAVSAIALEKYEEVVKKINDYVNIGDVIISGTIKNKDTIKDYVRANGKVFAEVWYHAKVEIPYSYQETTLTGNKKKVFSFRFLNKDIRPFSNFKTKEDNIIFSLYNPLIPISISLIEEKETNIEDSIYSEEVALIKAQDIAREKLKSNLGKDDVIIYEKYLKNREEDSKIIVDMFFKVNEDITGYMEIIPNIEEEKE